MLITNATGSLPVNSRVGHGTPAVDGDDPSSGAKLGTGSKPERDTYFD